MVTRLELTQWKDPTTDWEALLAAPHLEDR